MLAPKSNRPENTAVFTSWLGAFAGFSLAAEISSLERTSITGALGSRTESIFLLATDYDPSFHRIEAVAKLDDDTLRLLDIQDLTVRDAVEAAADARSLYLGQAATDY